MNGVFKVKTSWDGGNFGATDAFATVTFTCTMCLHTESCLDSENPFDIL